MMLARDALERFRLDLTVLEFDLEVTRREREALGLPGSFETTGQLSTAYANVLQYHLPPDFYNTYTPTPTSVQTARYDTTNSAT